MLEMQMRMGHRKVLVPENKVSVSVAGHLCRYMSVSIQQVGSSVARTIWSKQDLVFVVFTVGFKTDEPTRWALPDSVSAGGGGAQGEPGGGV